MRIIIIIINLLLACIINIHAQPIWQNATTSTGSGSPASINIPSSVSAGDLLVINFAFEKGSDENITAPSGWSLIRRVNNSSNAGLLTLYKVATGSEPGSYSFTFNNGSKWCLGISRITNANSSDIVSLGAIGSSGNPSAPSITTTSNNNLVLCFYTNKKDATYSIGGSQIERFDDPNNSEGLPSNCMGSFEQVTAGATGDQSATPSETENWIAMQVVITPAVPLAVELQSFKLSECNKNAVCLEWETVSEINNDNFSIQRSNIYSDWETIARIPGAGNSDSKLTYHFTDDEPLSGVSYYRLMQTDFDGLVSYSHNEMIEMNHRDNPLQIYPNPVSDWMVIKNLAKDNMDITIYDLYGNNLSSLTTITVNAKDEIIMDSSTLPKGIYYLNVNGKVYPIYKM